VTPAALNDCRGGTNLIQRRLPREREEQQKTDVDCQFQSRADFRDHPEGYPFIGGFCAGEPDLFWIWTPLGWIGTVLTIWCALSSEIRCG